FELTKEISVESFRTQLQAQLPEDIPIYQAEEISLQLPSSTKSLDKAVYFLALNLEAETASEDAHSTDAYSTDAHSTVGAVASQEDWANWVAQVIAADQVMHTKTTKSGKKKEVDLRSRLFQLEIVDPSQLSELPTAVQTRLQDTGQCIVRYVGSCRNDGTLLRPRGVLTMLETFSTRPLSLGHIHRAQLVLNS
ncbi:MAG: DUF2344 domain-containing protein, partial [Cyanobacteria bacterium J06650_10]